MGLPVRAAIHRVRASRPQVELDRAARAANVRRAFLAEAGALPGPRGALVDDVATTGATLHDAASAARAAGARPVRASRIGGAAGPPGAGSAPARFRSSPRSRTP